MMITITCLRVDAHEGLIGLSEGNRTPKNFLESNFESYESCTIEDDFNVYAESENGLPSSDLSNSPNANSDLKDKADSAQITNPTESSGKNTKEDEPSDNSMMAIEEIVHCKGWNLVSLPIVPTESNPYIIFGESANVIWEWVSNANGSGQFEIPAEIVEKPGIGSKWMMMK